MAKYLVTNGSNFQPFTYEELSRPLYEMAEAKRASQDQYDALSMQTEALRHYISENPGDDLVRQKYNAYVSQLNELQNNLWEHGYTPSTRKNLSLARNGFISDIQRIGKAIENRQKRSLEFREAKKKDASLITSADPGLDGLDEYFMDDLHGSDWYAYSGLQFEKEVGDGALARAQEILNGIDVEKDPRMAWSVRQIINYGATSEQIAKAGKLVMDALKNKQEKVGVDESTPEGVLANLLMSSINSTGARGRVDDIELKRLFDYGMRGLSKAIAKPGITNHKDEIWAINQDYNNWYRKEAQKRKWAADDAAAKKKAEDQQMYDAVDYKPREVTGENRQKISNTFKEYGKNNTSLSVSNKTNKDVRSNAEASELVYSADKKNDWARDIGWDIRIDPDKHGWTDKGFGLSATREKDYVSGIIEANGVKYETRYNPHKKLNGKKGVVEMRVADSGDDFQVSKGKTEQYRQYRKEYEDNINDYKENDKEIYKKATIDPDKQMKDYNEWGVPLWVPLTEARDYAMGLPSATNYVENEYYMSTIGTSDKMNDKLSDYISRGFVFDDKNKVIEDKAQNRTYTGGSRGIHSVNANGRVSKETISANDIFTFDEKHKINNVNSVRVTPSSIMSQNYNGTLEPGYIIVQTTKGECAIGIERLESHVLENHFANKQSAITRAMWDMSAGVISREEFDRIVDDACRMLTKEVWTALGYTLHPQQEGDTSANDEN